MLDIFLNFISSIATKVFEKYSPERDPTGKGLQKLFSFYTKLCLIYDYLDKFSNGLEKWKEGFYYGGDWSQCQDCIEKLVHVLAVIEDDIDNIIALEDFELSRNLKGYLHMKQSVFRIWKDIITENSEEYFCGWRSDYTKSDKKKTVFIPNYSLILSDVQATSELENLEESHWRRDLEESTFQSASENEKMSLLKFLPEIPHTKNNPVENIMVPHYCKVIVLPEETKEIDRIINTTRKKIEELHSILAKLAGIIKNFAGGNASVF